MENITIFLTPEDVEKFKFFQKHYDIISIMKEKGIFDIQFGKCILNVAFGEVQNIVKEEVVWKR